MTATIATPTTPARPGRTVPDPATVPGVDNRPVHLAWGGAWAVGYGAMALAGLPKIMSTRRAALVG